MTERAKRLGAYLESLDWNVFERASLCTKCHKINYTRHKYCSNCGNKLSKANNKVEVLRELEEAIQYALAEDNCRTPKDNE